MPLAEVLVEEEVGGSGGGGGGAAPLVTLAGAPEDAEEAAAVEAAVPPEHELAARAIVAFKLLRGDGLNYNAQRKTVRYVAALVRGELVRALVRAGAGGALLRARAEGAPPPPLAYASALRALRPRLPPPPAPTVTIWNVVLHGVPRLRGSPRASGCAPSFQLRSLPHQHLASVSLYDSAWSHPPGEIPVYDQESECTFRREPRPATQKKKATPQPPNPNPTPNQHRRHRHTQRGALRRRAAEGCAPPRAGG